MSNTKEYPIPLLPMGIDLSDPTTNNSFSNRQDAFAQLVNKEIIPYAFIRFSNEAITMQASLDSIKGFCSKGILAYHPLLPGIADDGSIAIAEKFVAENPGFRLVKYPVPVIYHGSEYIAQNLYRGNVSRYWLLDCFYNYALLHIKQLARENGEEDKAWLLKVDVDHVYDVQALKYAQQLAFERQDEYDSVLFSKYNVCFDHKMLREAIIPSKGIKRLLESLGLKKKPAVEFKPYFLSHPLKAFDHWLVRMNKLDHFIFVNTYNDKSDNPLKKFSNYERAVFTDDCRHDLDTVLLHSFHLNREKVEAYCYGVNLDKLLANGTFNMSEDIANNANANKFKAKAKITKSPKELEQYPVRYSSQLTEENDSSLLKGEIKEYSSLNELYANLPEFDGLNAFDRNRPEIANSRDSFWTAENLVRIGKSLQYPYNKDVDAKLYMRYYADFDKLVHTPEYRIENWLNDFNAKRNATTDPEVKKLLDIEAGILQKLFDSMTKEITNYSSHAGDDED